MQYPHPIDTQDEVFYLSLKPLPEMNEIKNKTISLGEGLHRGVTYVGCKFLRCERTTFESCTFKDCKFLDNVHTHFKNCNLDHRTKVHSHIALKNKMAKQLRRMMLSMKAHPDSIESDSEFAGYCEGAQELLDEYSTYQSYK